MKKKLTPPLSHTEATVQERVQDHSESTGLEKIQESQTKEVQDTPTQRARPIRAAAREARDKIFARFCEN